MTQLNQHLKFLTRFERFEHNKMKLGLKVMTDLMAALDNPHMKFPSIHIAGTNGKGSTAAFLASVLTIARHTTGLYTSPHLLNFNERVQINGKNIADDDLISLIAEVRATAQQHRLEPTYFEFTTALAFLYLAKRSVDIAVIEVGLGGLLDATNVITPLVSIITNIGLDHTEWLGHTKSAIATRKAGIIKPIVPVVTAETDPATLAYLKQVARQNQSPIFVVHENLTATVTNQSLTNQTFSTTTTEPLDTIQTPGVRIESTELLDAEFSISLLGQHQITNALTALLTLDVLGQKSDFSVKPTAIRKGLAETTWPGRLDIVSKHPFILVDGAHNSDSIKALSKFLDDNSDNLPPPDVLVLGLKQDKDIQPIIKHIAHRFRQIITTEGAFQPMPAAELAAAIGPSAQAIPDLAAALAQAQQSLQPDHLMLVTGSLYMVGDALSCLTASTT